MEINPNFELEECPICRGSGFVVHEGGWNVQVECNDCSAHTVYVSYENLSLLDIKKAPVFIGSNGFRQTLLTVLYSVVFSSVTLAVRLVSEHCRHQPEACFSLAVLGRIL